MPSFPRFDEAQATAKKVAKGKIGSDRPYQPCPPSIQGHQFRKGNRRKTTMVTQAGADHSISPLLQVVILPLAVSSWRARASFKSRIREGADDRRLLVRPIGSQSGRPRDGDRAQIAFNIHRVAPAGSKICFRTNCYDQLISSSIVRFHTNTLLRYLVRIMPSDNLLGRNP